MRPDFAFNIFKGFVKKHFFVLFFFFLLNNCSETLLILNSYQAQTHHGTFESVLLDSATGFVFESLSPLQQLWLCMMVWVWGSSAGLD